MPGPRSRERVDSLWQEAVKNSHLLAVVTPAVSWRVQDEAFSFVFCDESLSLQFLSSDACSGVEVEHAVLAASSPGCEG